jgi:hypothetical protein
VIESFLQELYPWNLEEFKKFSVMRTFFLAIFAAIGLNLGVYYFVVKSSSSSSSFGVIESFLQELHPLKL